MPQLSVVIITFNEERNIDRCLRSVKELADEVVVMDSFSTDGTERICREHGVRFIQRAWEGYSATKNAANASASFDWILSLDADEAPSPRLIQSILELKKKESLSTASFNRLTNYCGSWIRHCGWYPDVKIRLFDRRNTRWVGHIHEELNFSQPVTVQHIEGDLLHYSYYSMEEHYRQAEKFATLSAENMFAKGKKTNGLQLLVKPAFKFFRNYVIKLGFLDGISGYRVCRIAAYETYLKYSKLSKLHQTKRSS